MKTFILGLMVGVGVMGLFQYVNQTASPAIGATSNGDMIGIYNATPFTLRDGYGSALAVDEHGRLIATSTTP